MFAWGVARWPRATPAHLGAARCAGGQGRDPRGPPHRKASCVGLGRAPVEVTKRDERDQFRAFDGAGAGAGGKRMSINSFGLCGLGGGGGGRRGRKPWPRDRLRRRGCPRGSSLRGAIQRFLDQRRRERARMSARRHHRNNKCASCPASMKGARQARNRADDDNVDARGGIPQDAPYRPGHAICL